VVPSVVALGAGGFFQGSVAIDGNSSLAAVEDDGPGPESIFYLSTQNDVCMSDDGLQVMSPGHFGVVSSSLVDGTPVSSHCPRAVLDF
jgi:hypothetical protein